MLTATRILVHFCGLGHTQVVLPFDLFEVRLLAHQMATFLHELVFDFAHAVEQVGFSDFGDCLVHGMLLVCATARVYGEV